MIWITTQPNPRSPATGHDAGVTGWKLHAMEGDENTSFAAIRYKRAVCGLRGKFGWSLDMFVEDKCQRCEKALEKMAMAAAKKAEKEAPTIS